MLTFRDRMLTHVKDCKDDNILVRAEGNNLVIGDYEIGFFEAMVLRDALEEFIDNCIHSVRVRRIPDDQVVMQNEDSDLVMTWKGNPITDLSREELIDAIEWCAQWTVIPLWNGRETGLSKEELIDILKWAYPQI